MKKYSTLILDKKTIEKLVDIRKSIIAIERAFYEYGKNRVQMPPKIYLHLGRFSGDFRAMPVYADKFNKCALKWVNVHPKNYKSGLPAVMAIIILNDPRNGFPLCVMDGTYATALRTAAAGAVAAKYLARPESALVSLIGSGRQARMQLSGLYEIFPIKKVKIWSPDRVSVNNFIKEMKSLKVGLLPSKTAKSCVENSDIVVTTTPSSKPLIKRQWLKKGVHINAMGADAKGKQELDPWILKSAKVVVDNWQQAVHSGEINMAFAKGIIHKRDIYADIGEIVFKSKGARADKNEITVFDSTGLAIQDLAIADLIYKSAIRRKAGKWFKFF